jgi:hypothetical protein
MREQLKKWWGDKYKYWYIITLGIF